MIRVRLLTAVALAAGLSLGATAGGQPVVRPVAPPPAVPVVPASAGAFVTLRVSDLAKHPDLKPVLAELARQPAALEGVTEVVGVAPTEIDRVTLFWPRVGRDPGPPALVVTTVEPYNEARVLKTLQATAVFGNERGFGRGAAAPAWNAVPEPPPVGRAPKIEDPPVAPPPLGKPIEPPPPPPGKDGDESLCAATVPATDDLDPLFYDLPRGPFGALFLLDDRTLLFLPGRGDGELTALALLGASLKKDATGPLADALAAASRHTFAAGVYLPPLLRDAGRRVEPELAPYTALLGTRTAVLTGDLDRTAKLTLTLRFDDATAARRAAPVLEEGVAAIGAKVEGWAGELRDSRRPFDRAAAPVVAALAAGLTKAAVRADGPVAVAAAEVDAGPAVAKAFGELLLAVESRRKAELRTQNLKLIGLALHSYHDVHGRFPANVYGPRGELLLSWRVQLLPYLEQAALYQQFKMDEPWDGPNNKKLVEQMPKVFQAPDRAHAKGETFYQGFVEREKLIPVKGLFGRPWLKDGEKGGLPITAISDGTSNTLAVVEAGGSVVWTKPDDLPFGGKVPPLGETGRTHTPALRFDGSTFLLPTDVPAQLFWPHVTINGGEVTPDLGDDRGGLFGRGSAAPAPDEAVTTKEPRPAPLPPPAAKAAVPVEQLKIRLAEALVRRHEAEGLAEAARLVVERLEALAGKGVATQPEVDRARAVSADKQARLDAIRKEIAALQAEVEAAIRK